MKESLALMPYHDPKGSVGSDINWEIALGLAILNLAAIELIGIPHGTWWAIILLVLQQLAIAALWLTIGVWANMRHPVLTLVMGGAILALLESGLGAYQGAKMGSFDVVAQALSIGLLLALATELSRAALLGIMVSLVAKKRRGVRVSAAASVTSAAFMQRRR